MEGSFIKGKVQLITFMDIDKYDLSDFDIKLQVVLSIKKGLLKGFIHVPQLAPSEKLFNTTMYKWKKLKFSKLEREEMRCGKTHTWWDLYYSRFTHEIKERRDFRNAYNRLKYHLDSGKNIVLACYCENLKRCHMYIIKEILENDGYVVMIN